MAKKNSEIFSVEIPDFITQIQVSKARKNLYYEMAGKYPVPASKAKHISPLGKCKYYWDQHNIGKKSLRLLTDINTKLPVLKNSLVAGKPKFQQIKGNAFYSGFGSFHQRIMIIDAIKDQVKNYFNINPVNTNDFPIRLEFIIYNEFNVKNSNGKFITQDGDNMFYPYTKSIQDLMRDMNIIPDDNLYYIRKSSWEFIPDKKVKKLVIKAFKY